MHGHAACAPRSLPTDGRAEKINQTFGAGLLRLTRVLEPGFVVTVEPGLYFIDSLLEPLRCGEQGKRVNWNKVEALRPFGGIRIEDNVVLHGDGVENLTRQAGL